MKNFLEDTYLESGIRNIRKLSKTHNTAAVYFHMDLDGVTSAIGMKEYLKQYGIKTVDTHHIQYGDRQYSVPKPTDKTLNVLVDFSQGNPIMHIHTDHHEGQIGADPKEQSTSFVKSPSNAAYISQKISTRDLFPPRDADFINMIDSADYASRNISPEDVIRAMFNPDRKQDLETNKRDMGFSVNKLILSFKNNPQFLEKLVLRANPSLISMYNVIKQLSVEMNLDKPFRLTERGEDYITSQKGKVKKGDVEDIPNMQDGDQLRIGNMIVQFGGGDLKQKGKYDRYVVFKNNKDIHYFCMGWPFGMVQISKNPFMKGRNPLTLGMFKSMIINKFSDKLSKKITILDMKKTNESKVFAVEKRNLVSVMKKDVETLTDFMDLVVDISGDEKVRKIFYLKKLAQEAGSSDDVKVNGKLLTTLVRQLNQDQLTAVYDSYIDEIKNFLIAKDEKAEAKAKKDGKPFEKAKIEVKNLTEPMGYTFFHLMSQFGDLFDNKEKKILKNVMDKKFVELNDYEKRALKKFELPMSTIVEKLSGGHKDITNITGLSFYNWSQKTVGEDLIKPIMQYVASQLKDKSLDPEESEEQIEERKKEERFKEIKSFKKKRMDKKGFL